MTELSLEKMKQVEGGSASSQWCNAAGVAGSALMGLSYGAVFGAGVGAVAGAIVGLAWGGACAMM